MRTVPLSFSSEQQQALEAIERWRTDRTKQIFRLFGYAGTGKSTLAQEFLGEEVLFGAFTGKAAHVLRKKGVPARTLHSLIYHPRNKSTDALRDLKGRYRAALSATPRDERMLTLLAREIEKEERSVRQPAFSLNLDSPVRSCSMLVIDEVSMVGEQMGEDLCSFGRPVLVLGDPGQLPPIASGGYFTEDVPDVLLIQIHRQAESSYIITLATMARKGIALRPGMEGVVKRGSTAFEIILSTFDQILCGRNATRRMINSKARDLLFHGVGPFPVKGEKIICLRNNYENGLLNGGMWEVEDCDELNDKHLLLYIKDEDGVALECLAHKDPFLGKEVPYEETRDADSFDYGYAITVHKAQGSQWENVYVVDESRAFGDEASRWLYTAITRASENVVVAVDPTC